MKFYSRLKKYKASNCEFDCSTQIATSYGWWLVTRQVNGVMIFNNYRYSVSTSKHQNKILSLLRELGIKIDLYCEAPRGLQDLNGAIACHKASIEILKEAILNPRSKKETNAQRYESILYHTQILNKLIEVIGGKNVD